MTRKRWLINGVVLVFLIAAPIGWYLLSPLFITHTVNENFPVAQAAPIQSRASTTMQQEAPMQTMVPEATTEVMIHAETMTSASPSPAPSEPLALKSGAFHAVEHEGRGTATIYQLPDGKHVLRLENFNVLNGPDLYVWLSTASNANDGHTILNHEYVSLGRLKGNEGNQNYELPADLNIDVYNSVTIWCQRFGVNFATAPLT
jgi:hypothetical protein